ncbi:hypothetical protein AO398_00340 [Methylobacterium sp. GXS13]|nr:hypothetical protein AO398_00340 [Methylobacterium sp. GXS13]
MANLIMSSDPDLMRRAYEKAWHWESETAGNPEMLRADEQALVTRLPMFEEFDRIGTRHFVPYGESRRGLAHDELLDGYLDLSRIMVFMRNRLQPDVGRRRPLHDEKEHKVLLDTIHAAKDRRFRSRVEEALRRCHAYRQGFGAGKEDPFAGTREPYSDAEVEIFALPYGPTPENETGIVFKKSDEYAVSAVFHRDDGRISEDLYRNDRQFVARTPLSR